MDIRVYATWEQASRRAAEQVVEIVRRKPNAAICFATGNTPKLMYRELVREEQAGRVSLADIRAFALDEPGTVPESGVPFFRAFLDEHVYGPVGLREEQIHSLNPRAQDLNAECRRYEAAIRAAGGFDLVILGVGLNGHLAYNEPGSLRDSRTRRVPLAETTSQVTSSYFAGESDFDWGLTVGLADILEAKHLLVLANGAGKADIVQQALEGPVGVGVPASFLQEHSGVQWFLESEAASKLRGKTLS
ncbi:glucosamine-6-phosphate deaminase [Tumebacillus sp. ITR2]|uniref:Glucosamine-6-phosphate deaminase n=1 Tax=Tumebacillus amylolyticus TaxID=2801339 RepID=A0ABS1JC17_9BACL|nr:glucosamine-6-phosphate deaminase [Tumebacillus amylolyticus]MBL0387780.1 glucosamine-6-phosphate deaminase [Tumebacillus amylolyticus]